MSLDVAGAEEVTEREKAMTIDDEGAWAEVGRVDLLSMKLVDDGDHLREDGDGLLSSVPAVFLDLFGERPNERVL